jgi:uridylate kinase
MKQRFAYSQSEIVSLMDGGNPYLQTDLLAAILTLFLMLDDGLIITAVDVHSDDSIQCDANAQELEHLIQESSVVVTER